MAIGKVLAENVSVQVSMFLFGCIVPYVLISS